jgi:hypothetical protein
MSIPLADDVPPRRLLRPVHSAGRRRPVHPAGGMHVHSAGKRYVHTVACTTLIMTRALPGKQLLHISTVWTEDITAPGDCPSVACMRYFYNVFPLFCSWAHMSGLSILVCAPPLSYKREGTRRYKADPTQIHSDSQVHTSSQAHILNTTHSGVGYYAPAA